jgi:Domain of unknown function (DUF5668)
MIDSTRKFDTGALFTGIVLIAFGLLFLLDRAGIADFSDIMREWWPMFLVVIGVTKIASRRLWGGLWLIAIGAWLQVVHLGLFGLTFGTSWPLLLIVLGAGMIVRTLVESARRRDEDPPEHRHEA